VARYIRRSKPSAITVDHVEGNSSFYKLSDEGRKLFDDKYRQR
jgi:DNA-binding transcriptional regulator PaaX